MADVSIPPAGVYRSANKPEQFVIEGTKVGMTGPARFLHARISGRGYVVFSNEDGDIGEFDIDLIEWSMKEIRR